MRLHVREEARSRGLAPPFSFLPGSAPELTQSWRIPAWTFPLPAPGWVRKGVFTHTRRPFPFSHLPLRTPQYPARCPRPNKRHVGQLVAEPKARSSTNPIDFPDGIKADNERQPAGPSSAGKGGCGSAPRRLGVLQPTVKLALSQPRRASPKGCRTSSRYGKTEGCPQHNLGRTPDGGSRSIGLSCLHNLIRRRVVIGALGKGRGRGGAFPFSHRQPVVAWPCKARRRGRHRLLPSGSPRPGASRPVRGGRLLAGCRHRGWRIDRLGA